MKNQKRQETAYLTGCLLLYLLPALVLGSRLYNDSDQYIVMHIHREPLYPLWLLFFRSVLPEAVCYRAAGLVQCVLNALATYVLALRLKRLFSLDGVRRALIILLAFLPQALTYFGSSSRMYMAGDILSESLAYPLFLITMMLLIETAVGEGGNVLKQRVTWGALFAALILSLLRGQMIVLGIVWFLTVCLRLVREHSHGQVGNTGPVLRGMLVSALCVALFLAGRNLFVRTYFYVLGEGFDSHSIAMSNVISHVLYVSEEEDAAAVPDSEPFFEKPDDTLRDYFLRMCDKMDTMRMNLSYEEGSLYARNSYMESCRDPIAYDIAWRTIYEAVDVHGYDYNTEDAMANEVNGALVRALMPVVFPRWISVYARHVTQGIICSVGITHPVLSWLFLVLFAAAVGMTLNALLKKTGQGKRYALATVPLLLFLLGNACAVALLQFCIQRYMFYAFPLFYILYGNWFYERLKGAI